MRDPDWSRNSSHTPQVAWRGAAVSSLPALRPTPPERAERKESSSFLITRTKKLLVFQVMDLISAVPIKIKCFLFLFFKKNTYLLRRYVSLEAHCYERCASGGDPINCTDAILSPRITAYAVPRLVQI